MRGIRDRLWWRLRGRVDRLRGGPGEPVEVPDAETFEQVVAVDAAARAWNAPAWVEAAARRLASGHAGLADL
ncbi:MAG: hypothetical protein HOQ46_20400, partial [Saccharothrix sp.]|nr:hypothetical protein [Saccharothrix sp.]